MPWDLALTTRLFVWQILVTLDIPFFDIHYSAKGFVLLLKAKAASCDLNSQEKKKAL